MFLLSSCIRLEFPKSYIWQHNTSVDATLNSDRRRSEKEPSACCTAFTRKVKFFDQSQTADTSETELVANVVGFSDRSSGWLQPWSSWKKSSWAAWSDVQHRKLVSKDSVCTKVDLYSSADWNHTDFCWNQWIVFFFLFRLSLCPTGHEHSPEQGWLTRKSLSWHDICLIIERWACLSNRKFMTEAVNLRWLMWHFSRVKLRLSEEITGMLKKVSILITFF